MDRTKALSLDEVLNLVRAYKQVIRYRYHSEPKVYLYGSYAKGNAHPDSDIDVAVVEAEGETVAGGWIGWSDLLLQGFF